jgi:predicted dehydrogenase
VARTISELPRAEVRWLCDRDPKVSLRARDGHSAARTTVDLDDLLCDERLDAVVVATPPPFRAEVARRALDAHKHVLVREPIALAGAEADDLVARAEGRFRQLATAGGLVHDPAVRGLSRLLERGELGEVYYLSLRRQEPGPDGADVLWGAAVTDVSLVLALLRDAPVQASAVGECYVEAGVRDVVCCNLRFATGIAAHLHVSRLGRRHVRELSVIGSRRAAVLDAARGRGELSLCEASPDSPLLGEEPALGTVVTHSFAPSSPLRLECEAFLEALRVSDDSFADARRAATTVNVLEALDASHPTSTPLVPEAATAAGGAEVVHLHVATAKALLPGL